MHAPLPLSIKHFTPSALKVGSAPAVFAPEYSEESLIPWPGRDIIREWQILTSGLKYMGNTGTQEGEGQRVHLPLQYKPYGVARKEMSLKSLLSLPQRRIALL